jgi:two-component system cell cycle sensor histidine kinase/response regulator CckA
MAMKSASEVSGFGKGSSLRRKWAEVSKISLLVFVLLSLGVIALWSYALTRYRERQMEGAYASLHAIADLKVGELTQWQQSHLDYGRSLMRNSATVRWIADILGSPADGPVRQEAREWMQGLVKQYDFLDVVLVDPSMEVVLSSEAKAATIGAHGRRGLAQAIERGAVELSDLHAVAEAREVHLDLYVPMFRGQGSERIPLGAFLFRVDPRRILYPLIRSWPLQDESGGCELVRREGHEVVYLNQLRNATNTPLMMRSDVSETNLPAALAVLGMDGLVSGVDAHGVPVLAVSRQVPGAAWWLVAKKDRREVLAPLRTLELLLTLTGVALINLALFALGFSVYRQRKDLALARAREESERLALSRHYSNLAKYANDIILLVDAAGQVIEVNDRALRSYGYTREAMLAFSLKALWPTDRQSDCFHAIQRAQREHSLTVETVHRRADGSTFPVEVNLRAINESGVKLMQAVIRDISERIQRRLFFDRYQALSRNARDIILFMNREGQILEANEAAEHAYEYTREEMVRLRIHDLRAPRHLAELDQLLEEAASRAILFETEHRTKSGRLFPVEVSATPVTIGGERVILSIIRDSSQRKQVEQALVVSERNLKHIMDVVPQIIYARDDNGQIMLVNHRFTELAGKTQEELLAGARMALTEQDREVDAEVIRSGQPVFIPEATWSEDDGTLHTLQTTKALFVPSGQSRPAVLSVSTDITENKRLHDQLLHAQKMESVGRLAGGIAHDFNNLLQAILGFNEILMNRMDDDNPGRQDAMEIAKAAKRAGDLTKQLLAYSRKQVMDLQVRDLNAIVNRMTDFLMRLVGEGIQIAINLSAQNRPVRVDVSQIEQVLMNLVVNARDAMPSGGRVSITTSAIKLADEEVMHIPEAYSGSFVCLSVGDTGMGISEEVLAHIFEPFFTTKGLGKGTGLGLSMVYGIVKQHGGWITVYSQIRMGTTLRLYFPVADQPAGVEEIHEELVRVPQELRASRVLVVEDEDGVRQFAVRVLREHGFLVYASRTVEEALAMFAEQRGDFDVVFSDVVLPDGNGVKLAGMLRNRKPDMRFLFTSGYMDIQERWPEIKEQQWLFLQKPYPIKVLIDNIVAALKIKDLSSQKRGGP